MQSTGAIEPTGSPVSLRAIRNICRTMLAGLPLGAALVFDHEFRVRLAEGEGFAQLEPVKLVGSVLPDVVPADVWKTVEGPYERALRGHTTTFDVGLGGRMFSVRVLPLALPGETRGALAISHEITEQRRLEAAVESAEEQLHDSERTLRSIIDNTPALVYVKGCDYRYQLVNREFELAHSVRGDWIVGRADEDLLPDDQCQEVRAKDRLVLEGGQTVQEEETVRRGGQERVFLNVRFPLLDDHAEIQGVCCMATDVTDRRREESVRRERLQCSERIHSALAQDRFVLHGQPIVDLVSMRVEQSELLIRMISARGADDLVPPGEFLPSAERFDLVQVIDEWVVCRAVELAANGHVVNVNLSAKTISDPAQVDRIAHEILASGAPPQNFIFEITETAVAENLDAARDFALRLRKLGCAFALDDFGVGHGTFTYLRHLAVDYLKIDIQFVRDLLSEEAGRQVVQAIIGVARQFGIKTIAEGVEDQATLEELRRLGVDYAQGYWIGRPMPLPDLWELPTHLRGALHAARP